MANQWTSIAQSTPEVIEKRRFEVVKLRRTGHTFDEIAEKISVMFNRPISNVMVAEDFRIVMKKRAKELHEETDAIRESQAFRILSLVKLYWGKVERGTITVEETEVLIKLETRLSKLLGTDAPLKSEIDDKRRKPQLTAEQMKAKMAEIYGRLAKQGIIPAPPPQITVEATVIPESKTAELVSLAPDSESSPPSTDEASSVELP